MSKLPSFQFYPGDWKKDIGVQSLSFHDRAVWFEMMLLMHESPVRGKLMLGPKAMTEEILATLLHIRYEVLQVTLNTLLDRGVTERDEETGALICRRIIRDESVRAAGRKRIDKWRKSHKTIEMPASNAGVTPDVTGSVTPDVTAKKPVSVTGSVTPMKRPSSSSSSASASREEASASSPCAAAASPATDGPTPAGPTEPSRHTQCKGLVLDFWRRHHPGEASMPPWDGGEAKQLSLLLAANPVLSADAFERLLLARSASEVNHSERPKVWLDRLTDYAGGPLDRYGKPKGDGNGANTSSANSSGPRGAAYARVERTRNAFRDAARSSIERAGGYAAGPDGSGVSGTGAAPGHVGDVPTRDGAFSGGVWVGEGASGARKIPNAPEVLPPSQRSARGA
jgi:hypothetical protein